MRAWVLFGLVAVVACGGSAANVNGGGSDGGAQDGSLGEAGASSSGGSTSSSGGAASSSGGAAEGGALSDAPSGGDDGPADGASGSDGASSGGGVTCGKAGTCSGSAPVCCEHPGQGDPACVADKSDCTDGGIAVTCTATSCQAPDVCCGELAATAGSGSTTCEAQCPPEQVQLCDPKAADPCKDAKDTCRAAQGPGGGTIYVCLPATGPGDGGGGAKDAAAD
ncbi:MAG TPA: hypothetical protein VGG39_26130 [Polyangiaceae bacterium]|jgi:hypothetical protein